MRAEFQKKDASACPFCFNADVGHFDIHHIDENPSINVKEKLLLLCPICHSKIMKGDMAIKEVKQVKTLPSFKQKIVGSNLFNSWWNIIYYTLKLNQAKNYNNV